MIVAIPRRAGRGMGDAIDDALAGACSDPLASASGSTSSLVPQATDSLMVPSWASSSSAASPISGSGSSTQGNNSSAWSWGDIAKQFVGGLLRPISTGPRVNAGAASSAGSTLVVLGVGAAVVLGAIFLLRKHD